MNPPRSERPGREAVVIRAEGGRGWQGKRTGLPAARLWIALFEAQGVMADTGLPVSVRGPDGDLALDRPLTDGEIDEVFIDEYGRGPDGRPRCKDLGEHLAAVRSKYNGGQLRPQKGRKPDRRVGRFDDRGIETGGSRDSAARRPPTPTPLQLLKSTREELETRGDFQVDGLEDARLRTLASIVRRQGQGEFRNQLLAAYGGRCAVTGCDVPEALEAAHIVGYLGTHTNRVTNGLLLRADIHTLFDLYLLGIDPELRVRLAPALQNSIYHEYGGQTLSVPEEPAHGPNLDAVRRRYEQFLSGFDNSP